MKPKPSRAERRAEKRRALALELSEIRRGRQQRKEEGRLRKLAKKGLAPVQPTTPGGPRAEAPPPATPEPDEAARARTLEALASEAAPPSSVPEPQPASASPREARRRAREQRRAERRAAREARRAAKRAPSPPAEDAGEPQSSSVDARPGPEPAGAPGPVAPPPSPRPGRFGWLRRRSRDPEPSPSQTSDSPSSGPPTPPAVPNEP